MKNYYEILEVNQASSKEVIQRVYKLLAKKYHPDTQEGGDSKAAEEKFKEIAEAYEVLSNDEKRAAYDQQLEEFQKANTPDFQELKDYCSELENELTAVKNDTSDSFQSEAPQYQEDPVLEKAQRKAYDAAVQKAYQDAYTANLRRMGYRVRYKKTFKQTLKNFVTLVLTFGAIALAGFIAWQIPSVRAHIIDLFSDVPILKNLF